MTVPVVLEVRQSWLHPEPIDCVCGIVVSLPTFVTILNYSSGCGALIATIIIFLAFRQAQPAKFNLLMCINTCRARFLRDKILPMITEQVGN